MVISIGKQGIIMFHWGHSDILLCPTKKGLTKSLVQRTTVLIVFELLRHIKMLYLIALNIPILCFHWGRVPCDIKLSSC